MAEKKYLDYAGLQTYNDKLKLKMAADHKAITDIIGDSFTAETTVQAAVLGLDTKIGDLGNKTDAVPYTSVVEYVNDKVADAQSSSTAALYELAFDTDTDTTLAGVSTPKKGDVAIINRTLTTGNVEKSAYQYNGTQWVACDGLVDADKVILTDDITLAGDYTQVGNLTKTQTGTATFSTAGMSVADALVEMLSKKLQPSVKDPSVDVDLSTDGSKKVTADIAYEVGTKVSPKYVATFSAGSYTYGPATGLTATWAVTNNTDSASRTTATGTMDEITVADDTAYTVTAKATYGDGATPKDNLGGTATVAGIAAGSKSDVSDHKIVGYRNVFYGAVNNTDTVTSALIRGLSKTGHAAKAEDLSVGAGTGRKRVIIAIPNSSALNVTKVIMPSAMNAAVTGQFVKQTGTVMVAGADGYDAIAYKYWVYQPADFTDDQTFTITLG